MIHNLLKKMGLNENEAKIYLNLLKIGTSMVGNIINKTELPRATVYDSLKRLTDKNLVVQSSKNGKVSYTSEPPETLFYGLKKRKDEIENLERSLEKVMPELKGYANEFSILPKIRFYEGLEGIKKVLDDSLSAKEIIYTYVNQDLMEKHIKEMNIEYLKQRKNLKIYKKGLIVGTPFSRIALQNYDKTVSEARLLKAGINFGLEMEIYDGKISYITFTNDKPVGIIIENKEIYQMHRNLFEMNWELAEKI